MKLKEIPKNTVVHTPTEEEAKELLAILHENGYIWNDGNALNKKTLWYYEKDATCYNIRRSKKVTFESEYHYEENGKIILTLAEFKERYCEEEKPQSKFKSDYNVGDIVVVTGSFCENKGNKITLLKHYDVPREANDYNNVWVGQDDTGDTFAIDEKDFEPYTEPETKPTQNMETKGNLNLSQDVANCDKLELNIRELLHKGDTVYSLIDGIGKVELLDEDGFYLNDWHLRNDGTLTGSASSTAKCLIFPSRALYEQYPLDPYTAWMKWQEGQK